MNNLEVFRTSRITGWFITLALLGLTCPAHGTMAQQGRNFSALASDSQSEKVADSVKVAKPLVTEKERARDGNRGIQEPEREIIPDKITAIFVVFIIYPASNTLRKRRRGRMMLGLARRWLHNREPEIHDVNCIVGDGAWPGTGFEHFIKKTQFLQLVHSLIKMGPCSRQ